MRLRTSSRRSNTRRAVWISTKEDVGRRLGLSDPPPTLLLTTIRTIIHPYHRGAFWRLLAALQIQLNRSLSNPSARQRFSRAGLFRFL